MQADEETWFPLVRQTNHLRCKYCNKLGIHERHVYIDCWWCRKLYSCINRNKRKKDIMETYSLESVLWPKRLSKCLWSALIRKNLVVDYLEKDVMQTHLVKCLRDVFGVIEKSKGEEVQAWFIKPPEKSNASGVKAFQDAQLELGDVYFESEKMQSKTATTFVLQPYLPPLLLEFRKSS